jgi:ankyrin repeat domain-containing protein 17
MKKITTMLLLLAIQSACGMDKSDASLLHYASCGDYEGVELALANGANVNVTGDDGITALMSVLPCHDFDGQYVDTKLVKLLIASKADVNAEHPTFGSALLYAAKECSVKAIQLLLDAGAQADCRNTFGDTALMRVVHGIGSLSCLGTHPEQELAIMETKALKLLLEAKADVNAKTLGGHTALSLAVWNTRPAAVAFLKSRGALVEMPVEPTAADSTDDCNATAILKNVRGE